MKGFFCAYISVMQRLSFDGMYCTKYRTMKNLPGIVKPTINREGLFTTIYCNFVGK